MAGPADGVALSNGVRMPWLGFGVWQIPDGEPVVSAVGTAVGCDPNLRVVPRLVAQGPAPLGLAHQPPMTSGSASICSP